jgi:hypothetical protein
MNINKTKLSSSDYEADFNLMGFFNLLYKIDTRINNNKKQNMAQKKVK